MKRFSSVFGKLMSVNEKGAWVRYADVDALRGDLMAHAEFQQQVGDALGFRRGLRRAGCTDRTVEMLVREDRS
jgi:hypothetical protein